MPPPLILYTANRLLVQGFGTKQLVTEPIVFFSEDEGMPVQIHNLETAPGGDPGTPWAYKALGGTTQLGVGNIDVPPTEGTFTITDTVAPQTTGAIAYNATAAVVQAALRTGCSTNYGSCVVTGNNGGPWIVDRVTLTDIGPMTGNGDGLFPDSFVAIGQLRVGSAYFSKKQQIQLLQKPAAFLDDWAALPVAAVAVTSTQAGGTGINEVQRIALNSDTYSGTFTLAVGSPINKSTGAIPYNASAQDFTDILTAAFGTGKEVTVTKSGLVWFVEFTGVDVDAQAIALMTGDPAGLKVPVGLKGTLNLKTTGIKNLVGAQRIVDTTLEIKNIDPYSSTILQIGVRVRNILLDDAATGATALPTYVTLTQLLAYIKGTPSAVSEYGETPVDEGFSNVVIEFVVPKTSANWHFIGLYTKNLIDGPAPVSAQLVAQTDEGGTVELSGGAIDSNTVLCWHVVLNP